MQKIILSIDDEEALRNLFNEVLTNAGYKVISLPDTSEVYKILDENQIDLILLDIMLPKQDGIEFLQEIKSKSKYNNIPIIMFNNINNQEIIDQCYELGATDYWVTSQIMPMDLPLKVDDFFNSRA